MHYLFRILLLANPSKEERKEEVMRGTTATERTEALYGNDRIIKRILETFSWIKQRLDGCIDHTEPAIHIMEPIWSELVKLKEKGIIMRLVTEITSENVVYCKKLIEIAELRHLDGVRSNFGIADGKEYLGHTISQQDKPLSHAIISNVKGIVEAQQYLFEMLWIKGIPAEQKIRELEEGIIPIRTKLLENQDEIIKEIKRKNNAANKLSICTTLGGMQMSYIYLFDSYKNVVDKYKKGESKEGMRWLMNIEDKGNKEKEETLNLVKIFLNAGIQIRHIQYMPPLSFGVTDKEVAITIEKMERGKMSQSFLISSEPLYVSHFNSLFDELWKNGSDARERIKTIEEGIEPYHTNVLESPEEISNQVIHLAETSSGISIASVTGGMQLIYNNFFDLYKKVLDNHKKKRQGRGIKWVTNIQREAIGLVKIFLDLGMQIRHIRNLPPMNFAVGDKEVNATIEKMESGKMIQSLLYSNEPIYVNYFNSIFEELWKNGSDARERLEELEEGIEADIEVIQNPSKALDLYLDTVLLAKQEIMLIFPTTNAFIRQQRTGIIHLLREIVQERKVKVRILMPAHELTEQAIRDLKRYLQRNIDIRFIEQSQISRATFLVVDKELSLVMEIRDDSKETFDESIGLSVYSTSKAGVLSYVSIFDNLWNQTDLYEQIKIHDKMQKEFINVASHELRTPIQPILSLSEIARSRLKTQEEDTELSQLLDVISRNAKRLQRLTEDILDVTKIESQSLKLNKQYFGLKDIITNVLIDHKKGKEKEEEENKQQLKIKLLYPYDHDDDKEKDVILEADKARITQVISNLLSNAIKFTNNGGDICINIQKDDIAKLIIVSVMDAGPGIDPEILPRLFTKFASKSFEGTGLGLYISKNIVEAHGGRIWAENNPDGKGATFSFSLPVN
jgi:two-component system, OmpR family, sensor histidine kinase VicK